MVSDKGELYSFFFIGHLGQEISVWPKSLVPIIRGISFAPTLHVMVARKFKHGELLFPVFMDF